MNIFLHSGSLTEFSDCISQIVSLGGFVYMSAQTGDGDTIEKQAQSCIDKVIDAADEFGLQLYHFVKFTIYLTDMADKEKFMNVFSTYLEPPYPAATFLEVKGLENGAMVAMEAFGLDTTRHEKMTKDKACKEGCCSDSSCSC